MHETQMSASIVLHHHMEWGWGGVGWGGVHQLLADPAYVTIE